MQHSERGFSLLGLFALAGVSALSCLLPSPAWADSEVAVNTSATFQGSGATCSLCVETFTASFDWDTTTNTLVPGTMAFTTAGPLGPFALGFVTALPPSEVPIINWTDSSVDSIELHFNELGPSSFPALGSYSTLLLNLRCFSSPCLGDFGAPLTPPISGSVTVSAVSTPEPSTMLLILFGVSALILLKPARTKYADR